LTNNGPKVFSIVSVDTGVSAVGSVVISNVGAIPVGVVAERGLQLLNPKKETKNKIRKNKYIDLLDIYTSTLGIGLL